MGVADTGLQRSTVSPIVLVTYKNDARMLFYNTCRAIVRAIVYNDDFV